MDKVNWGILGTARIAEQQLIPAMQSAVNAHLLGVASRNETQANAYAQHNGIERAYGSYAQLLADPDIDAVYIPLPNDLHAEWTLQAAQAGKHVLCEKPAALNAAQAREMVQACAAHDVVFMEAFMYPFHPQWDRVRELLNSGELGELKIVHANFSYPLENPADIRWHPQMGGGSLYDVGCYCVHVARSLADNAPTVEVQGIAQFMEDGVVDKSFTGAFKFANGLLAHFDCSFEAADRQFVEIVGSRGSIQVLYPFRPDMGTPTLIVHGPSGEHRETFPTTDMYKLQVEHFGDCVQSQQTPRNTGEDSIRNMEHIDALYTAAGRQS
ncbi:gfo/Idh/MocA family oxidoreductase [Alicyclobacillaceae bacterium I2511]|nr:gfo/Idh/MocA family oxidoreductase [Alicyclobacillaceae bacterium I2511]